MNFQETLQTFSKRTDLGHKFFLLFEAGQSFLLRPVDIGDGDGDQLVGMFISRLRELAQGLTKNTVQSISKADGREGGIYHFDLQDVPPLLKSGFEALGTDDVGLPHGKLDSIAEAKAILLLIGKGQERICMYKHLYPIAVLRKKTIYEHVQAAGAAPSRLRLATNDFLRLDGSFHFIYTNDGMFCLGTKTIQSFYGFSDAVLAEARISIETIKSAVIVEDVEKMVERINMEDVALARRLVRAVGVSKVLSRVPADRVVAFTKSNRFYAGKFKYSPDGRAISLTSLASIKLFLKLISDDYLYSELTDSFYDVSVKDPA